MFCSNPLKKHYKLSGKSKRITFTLGLCDQSHLKSIDSKKICKTKTDSIKWLKKLSIGAQENKMTVNLNNSKKTDILIKNHEIIFENRFSQLFGEIEYTTYF